MKNKITTLILLIILSACKDNKTATDNINAGISSQNNNANQNISEQLWFSNPQYGLSFETPHKIREEINLLSQNTKQSMSDYGKMLGSYVYTDSSNSESDYGIKYMVIEMNPNIKQFDCQAGLKGSISNFINGWKHGGGEKLNLQFSEVKNKYNNKICEGSFIFLNIPMKVKGYCMFKNQKVYTLIGTGADNKIVNEKLNRTFNSIKIIGSDDIEQNSSSKNSLNSTATPILNIDDLIYLSDANNSQVKKFLKAKEYVFKNDDATRNWYYYDYNNDKTGTLRVVKPYGSYVLHNTTQLNGIPESLFYQTASKKYIEVIQQQLLPYKQKTEVSAKGIVYTFYSYKNKQISTSTSNADDIIILAIYK